MFRPAWYIRSYAGFALKFRSYALFTGMPYFQFQNDLKIPANLSLKSQQIPTLSGPAMDHFHYDTTLWQEFVTRHSNLFHTKRIEDAKEHLKFPLPPHRKTAFDFIFLTKGTSIRSKALNRYQFEAGTFFFLPAHQISSHEFYSKDACGYYCHFDT